MRSTQSFLSAKLVRSLALGATSLFVLSGCARNEFISTKSLVEKTNAHLGCQSFADEFWDSLYKFPLEQMSFPEVTLFSNELAKSLSSGRLSQFDTSEQKRIQTAIVELYELLTKETLGVFSLNKHEGEEKFEQVLATLTALELGDSTTPEKELMQQKIKEKFALIEKLLPEKFDKIQCPNLRTPAPPTTNDKPESSKTLLANWRSTRHPIVYGGLKSLVTAYQSCSAGYKRPIDSSVPPVEGITEVGKHPNGVGKLREIRDLSALLRSHYYISDYKKPASSCFDVQSKPMIYDYGGKPAATESENSEIDFFTNAGTGTKELGIDCSGYVYASLATAGLKLRKDGRLKAISVKGISAKMYMNPNKNGLSCLNHIQFYASSTIKPGDIIASPGHVLIVSQVGPDPFGVRHIQSIDECKIENMSESRFNFTVLQSAPVTGAIGIQMNQAKDYFAGEDVSMKSGIMNQAVLACRARFEKAGVSSELPELAIVRHSGELACRDRAIRLSRSECIEQCPLDPKTNLN